MFEGFIMESTAFDISMMEANRDYYDRMNMLDIMCESAGATEDIYMEGAVAAIKDFCVRTIEAIKKFFREIREKVSSKIREVQFEKRCKDLVKIYGANKSYDKNNGKLKIPDVRRYEADAKKIVKAYAHCMTEVEKRSWESVDDIVEYVEGEIESCERGIGWINDQGGIQVDNNDLWIITTVDKTLENAPEAVNMLTKVQETEEKEIERIIDELKRRAAAREAEEAKTDMISADEAKRHATTKFMPLLKAVGAMAGTLAIGTIGVVAAMKLDTGN